MDRVGGHSLFFASKLVCSLSVDGSCKDFSDSRQIAMLLIVMNYGHLYGIAARIARQSQWILCMSAPVDKTLRIHGP